jgi:hypothetical protein
MTSSKISRMCQTCKNQFSAYPSTVKVGKAKFCSTKCRNISDRVEWIKKNCEHCGTEFSVLPSSNRKDAARFCSRKCFALDSQQDQAAKFWNKVLKTETCWLWQAVKTDNGYGIFRLNTGQNMLAHRVSWEMHNSKIPEGLHVCHHCDVRNCVRPEHLFIGTRNANMFDCFQKGRFASKLKADDVRDIRKKFSQGESVKELAKQYDVGSSNIHLIVKRKSWKHVA